MNGFTEAGQLAPTIRWGDGSVDDPSSVLVACNLCGAAVLMTLVDVHRASHESGASA